MSWDPIFGALVTKPAAAGREIDHPRRPTEDDRFLERHPRVGNPLKLLDRKFELQARATRKWLNLLSFSTLDPALNLRPGDRSLGRRHLRNEMDDDTDHELETLRWPF